METRIEMSKKKIDEDNRNAKGNLGIETKRNGKTNLSNIEKMERKLKPYTIDEKGNIIYINQNLNELLPILKSNCKLQLLCLK